MTERKRYFTLPTHSIFPLDHPPCQWSAGRIARSRSPPCVSVSPRGKRGHGENFHGSAGGGAYRVPACNARRGKKVYRFDCRPGATVIIVITPINSRLRVYTGPRVIRGQHAIPSAEERH